MAHEDEEGTTTTTTTLLLYTTTITNIYIRYDETYDHPSLRGRAALIRVDIDAQCF